MLPHKLQVFWYLKKLISAKNFSNFQNSDYQIINVDIGNKSQVIFK